MRAAFMEHGWHDATQSRHEFQVGRVRLAVAGVDDPHHDLDDYAEIAGAPNQDADLALAFCIAQSPACWKSSRPTATSYRFPDIPTAGKSVSPVLARW